MTGPLSGFRVVELLGLGPGPFCGMLLADLGAEVLRVDRVEAARAVDRSRPATNAMYRSKAAIGLDLKAPVGVETFLRLTDAADAVFEVFRPGVAERLGIGPDVARSRNDRLVYGRLTGYGQEGPLAARAGHDIDYLAIAGALEPLGRADAPPTPPINILADFAGGGMLLAYGIVAALLARERTGSGQVVDAAMVDGAALMLTPFFSARASGSWGPRGTNMLDSGAPWYDSYETSDGGWLAVGAIEPQFYAELLIGLGLADADLPDQHDRDGWPALRARFASVIAGRTRDEWEAVFGGRDACVAPALSPVEAPNHPHNAARGTFLDLAGVPQPAPAPRFSATPAPPPSAPQHPGEDPVGVLEHWGFTADETRDLVRADIVV
ncbi:MAG TPA: CaiB/BaiF CoA-transferase family protein [Acidimicrobiia bacterium]|nr:CaiB/BaiF CoA-transferase family protein [Acidimicrobiia bacterium]